MSKRMMMYDVHDNEIVDITILASLPHSQPHQTTVFTMINFFSIGAKNLAPPSPSHQGLGLRPGRMSDGSWRIPSWRLTKKTRVNKNKNKTFVRHIMT